MHGTARFRASDLIEQALNGRTPTAYYMIEDGSRVVNQQETIAAREKQQQLVVADQLAAAAGEDRRTSD
jgi:N12 class adenine-specific DNA methylase